jgi:hypothetical protein
MTRLFREWKHDADILPRLQAQLEMLLEVYGKFEPVVYNTQGMHDDGADVVIRFRPENADEDWELIGFQVKSFDDLANPKYMRELKAQRDDAFRKVVGMRDYFLLLCTDGDADGDKVRSDQGRNREYRFPDTRDCFGVIAYPLEGLTESCNMPNKSR